jgi:Co/Zn/Cd efflux system component
MLADASAYTLALLAIGRAMAFKRNVARWSGSLLLILSFGIIIDVARRGLWGSEPEGTLMMGFSLLSLVVNIIVLRMLSKYRNGEPHLRASWIFTRADVVANMGVFVSGLVVSLTGARYADLVVGLAIGLYVFKEAVEIIRHANETRQGASTP